MILKSPTNPIPKLILLSTLLFTSFNGFSQQTIDYENFESGSFSNTIWNDGGNDCSLNSGGILNGNYAANLQDNSGGSSSMFTDNIDLTAYSSVDINFDFRTSGFNGGHDFFIEFSNNGGSTWSSTPIERYIQGTDFSNNTTYSNQSVTINNGSTYSFTSNSRFRFRCDAANNRDDLYIDEVTVSGTFSGPQFPEIDLTGGSDNSISNGDSTPSTSDDTDFGNAVTNSTINHTFTIKNIGISTTNLLISNNGSGIAITGGSGFFSVNSQPAQNTSITGGSSTTFSVDYTPITTGTHVATISIDNDDSDENPYTFTIQGTATAPSPEIEVEGNNTEISDGDTTPSTADDTDFGDVNISATQTKTFAINNIGSADLNISDISLSNTTNFSFIGVPYSSPVSAGNSTTFTILYTATALGTQSSTVTITNDDADESSYTFTIEGTGANITYTPITSGPDWTVTNITADNELDYPNTIIYGPDDFLWITERRGKKVVKVDPDLGGNKIVMLDLTSLVYQTAGQDGLMGMALHPDLYVDINTSNNFVYLAYTYDSNGRKLRIARYTYNAGTGLLNAGSATTIIDGIEASNDHNSGKLQIGPDLKLYYSIGDQGYNQFQNACQEIRSQYLPTSSSDYSDYKGKMLRLNLDGSIPSDNPTLNGVKSHVYTYGHRNAQGIVFGSNGILYSSEHGPKVDDEINIITAGKNYGWPEISGYYDNLGYGYCNWSSSGSCNPASFSDHNCPSDVTQVSEFTSGQPVNFQEPIGTYNSTTSSEPSGGWLEWPTVGPSSIDIYEAGLIPNWGTSLLIPTLKRGTIFRAKLNPSGTGLESQTYEEFHSSNDRYRDIALDPDGITIYAITDNTGGTSGPSGTTSVSIENPGVIVKIQYKCLIGASCDDGNPDTTNDVYDGNCNCIGTSEPDSDNDGVLDSADLCPDTPEGETVDADGCSDSQLDDDNDGIPNNIDVCPGFDDNVDTDADSIPDGCDTCPGFDDGIDVDTDGIPDGCDPLIDSDNDGVADSEDQCPGFDDTVDVDNDDIPDGCDSLIDSDNDGVADSEDQCPGFDDTVDVDNDGIPDGCDPLIDSDNDGVADSEDQCPGFDDTVDVDNDGIPDGCDPLIDSDNDGVADAEDQCPGFDDTVDTDADGFADGCDACPGFDDTIDVDTDGIPDGCDALIDSDNDGVADSEDQCPGFDDTIDVDNDGIPDDCDTLIDSDNDGVADSEDQCPGQDDGLIGTACDDGDACTINDVYDSNCECSGTVSPDNDGDGYCQAEDPDDTDPCIPDANAPACNPCGDIIIDGFESNFGNWNDGGNDCARNASNANSGAYSIRLRDNSGNSSSMYTDNLDLSQFSQISFSFSFFPVSMENGEDFFLELSTNGGGSYSNVQTWASGTHFNNNNRYYEDVTISGPFSSNTVLRLRCDASGNNDQVYIDDVILSSCVSQQSSRTQPVKAGVVLTNQDIDATENSNFKIYPNPASNKVFVECSPLRGNEASITLHNMIGQVIRKVDLKGRYNKLQEINVDGLSEGMYLLRITDSKGQTLKTDRIIIKVE